jgi:hypothetical protein
MTNLRQTALEGKPRDVTRSPIPGGESVKAHCGRARRGEVCCNVQAPTFARQTDDTPLAFNL